MRVLVTQVGTSYYFDLDLQREIIGENPTWKTIKRVGMIHENKLGTRIADLFILGE